MADFPALPSGRTNWRREFAAPMRSFLRTEAGSSGVLAAAILLALLWANLAPASYDDFWRTELSFAFNHREFGLELREWINSGLMTLFFLVVGLEARREFDLGDLRDRSRFVLPVLAGVSGMAAPILIYLAFNAGTETAHGWGVAMSTDTALALGLLALVGRGVPDRVRVFLLTVFVVDDLLALVVIAVVYSENIKFMPLAIALIAFGVVLALSLLRVRKPWVYVVLGVITWAALLTSGVDPVVAGLAIGLTAPAYSPGREELEQASGLFRVFREQPTPELARSATVGLTATISPNERLQFLYHPWTSYLIVPLFGLANAGVTIDAAFLGRAFTSPVTLGILIGYVVGKPLAVTLVSWLLDRFSRGRYGPQVGWAAVAGSGTIAGIGFTVSLLIATIAFEGPALAEAKIGLLSAVVVSSAATWAIFRAVKLLSPPRKALALLGRADELIDLVDPVDPEIDHVRGPESATVTLVEYGDFECPYCGIAESVVRDLLTDDDLRYVWRHLPLSDVHPRAQIAAEVAEAAHAQGAFWEMHDLLLANQDNLQPRDLMGYSQQLGLDDDRIHDEVKRHVAAARVARDVESADLSGVSGTPTFFINGRRHYGAYDVETLKQAIKVARARAKIDQRYG
ncbi:Na+/H+ antiporter NhaA [Kribbella sandramycini]|uniref:Na(+)/H(+) antiporter NhaA n=1 Tax=Kribbella sandramycini TaxID=60450 RepID=A0A7Y4P2E2_9ACTN|nr:Na+/H+ antiporter NhaA [Kribbella sandramycini]MBB6566297.1 Na+/H+ antiporter NhaA [Kribbella sandramycini]NOL43040.1 Na+/H+ antiporter NhaA [Kribbella sandramycini]